jgi:hypothetical protein
MFPAVSCNRNEVGRLENISRVQPLSLGLDGIRRKIPRPSNSAEGLSFARGKKANRFHCRRGRKRRHSLQSPTIGFVMERANFEPFGERLVPSGDARPQSRASKYLLWAGTGLFWSLVGAIVLARAAFFEPGVFDGFARVAWLAKGLVF